MQPSDTEMRNEPSQSSINAESMDQEKSDQGLVDSITEQMIGAHLGPGEESSLGQESHSPKEHSEETTLAHRDKTPSQQETQSPTQHQPDLQENGQSSRSTPSSASSTHSQHRLKLLEQEAMMRRALTGQSSLKISKLRGSIEEQHLVLSGQKGVGALLDGPNPNDIPALVTFQTPESSLSATPAQRNAEVPVPDGLGFFDKEVIGEFEPPKAYKADWRVPTEPDTPLSENGLPVPHVCQYCAHLVFDSDIITGERELLLSRSREHIARAVDEGCPLFRWLEWRLYGADVRDGPSQFSKISLRMTEYGIEGRWWDGDGDEKGRRYKGQWGKFGCFTTEGMLIYFCLFHFRMI
jgi:hypothetical protein